jgi:cobaltochelatase CobS
MVEQACAKLNREFIRVQVNPETDEDDLLGGFRLVDGETVFAKGPVLKAMENGAILLLDEIDRATNKIMCLQGILEGKPVLVKKTGEVIVPAPGFNIIATANTKGKGSEDGRYTAASIIDEAFLERFTISIDQNFATPSTETKIVNNHFNKFGVDPVEDKIQDFTQNLIAWADIIRKTFYDDGVDEIISTRRLCHIAQTYSIFTNRMKAIELCIARFDEDTKEAFLDLYTKVDSGIQFDETGKEISEEESDVE